VKPNWNDCGVHTQALILAYDQVRDHDEAERGPSRTGGSVRRGSDGYLE